MSSVVIKGNTSGQVTLNAPDVAGTTVLTLPTTSATLATDVNGTLYPLTSGTSQASTSGTSIDFTSIPSWVKRVTVMFGSVSLSGTDNFLLQLGSGSITTTGYNCGAISVSNTTSNSTTGATSSSGFLLIANNATSVWGGFVTFALVTGNTWVASGSISTNTSSSGHNSTAGSIVLSGTLDRIRISSSGTNTFDAGSINILYE